MNTKPEILLVSCVFCRIATVPSQYIDVEVLDGCTFQVALDSSKCPACEEEFIHALELQRGELLLSEQIRAAGTLGPSRLRYLRKALTRLSPALFSEHLGVAEEVYRSWEKDVPIPPEMLTAIWNLLQRDPDARALADG